MSGESCEMEPLQLKFLKTGGVRKILSFATQVHGVFHNDLVHNMQRWPLFRHHGKLIFEVADTVVRALRAVSTD